jgi:dolichyl-phosphate-mannose--protein O-mannosyl transferase
MAHTAGTALICAFVCFYVTMGAWFIARNSPTFDEPMHYYAGYTYLARGDFDISRELPPLSKEIAALPAYLLSRLHVIPPPRFVTPDENPMAGLDLLYSSRISSGAMLALGRLPMLLIGVLTLLLIARWAYRLWGMPAAIVASGLAVTEPTLVAHGSLITPDIALTFFFTLSFYLAWTYPEDPSLRRFLLTGIALGAALGSKFSAIVALPALVALAMVDVSTRGWVVPWRCRLTAHRRLHPYGEAAVFLVCIFGIAALTVVCIYAVHGIGSWRDGLIDQMRHASKGHLAFFWGRYSTHGWWYYFPVAFALKTPVLTLAAILASLALFRIGMPLRKREALFLLVPPLLLLGQ